MFRCLNYLIIFLLSGCVSFDYSDNSQSVTNYFRNRAMDAKDIVVTTGSLGQLGGFKLQLGPIGFGLYLRGYYSMGYGLRHGEFGSHSSLQLVFILGTDEMTQPVEEENLRRAKLRKKPPDNTEEYPVLKRPHNYTRIGFSIGLLGGIDCEVNPGEALDFVLGFFGIDIYSDDIYGKKNNEETKK